MGRHDSYGPWADYLRVWKRALAVLLGWPEPQTQAWADASWEGMGSGITWLNHELPQYWIAPLLIPEALRDRLGPFESERLGWRLADAISSNIGIFDYDERDWEAARARVEAILAEYEATLPRS